MGCASIETTERIISNSCVETSFNGTWYLLASLRSPETLYLLRAGEALQAGSGITYVRPVRDMPGCRIPVVRTLRVRVDWVQFPASRQFNL